MSNMEDTKSPVEILKEAARALSREAEPLTSSTKVQRAAALKEIADNLKRLSKGLRWIAAPLEWIAKPLKCTAAALMNLTPAALNGSGANYALGETAVALTMTAQAVRGILTDNSFSPPECYEKLKEIKNILPSRLRSRGNSTMTIISCALTKTALTVRES